MPKILLTHLMIIYRSRILYSTIILLNGKHINICKLNNKPFHHGNMINVTVSYYNIKYN